MATSTATLKGSLLKNLTKNCQSLYDDDDDDDDDDFFTVS